MKDQFASALRSGEIIDNPEGIVRNYRLNVTALERRIPLVLVPGDEGEVKEIIAVANRLRTPLYPISTGKNWGLGSKLPVTNDCTIVDLSRLNRIIEVNPAGRYAIIQPGVTQATLAEHLATHHPNLTMNVTGSFAFTSIVGNVLDRGDGAYARIDDLIGVRGFFGSGQPFSVGGVWGLDGDRTSTVSHVSRYMAGPDLTGLLSQANFGIVTAMAFRLSDKPERRHVIWGTVPDENLEHIVDQFDRLGSQRTIDRGSINIGYANRFLQSATTMEAKNVVPPDEWNFYVLADGTPRVADASAAELEEVLRPLSTDVGRHQVGPVPPGPGQVPPFLAPLLKPLVGIPDNLTLAMIYRLTGTPLPEDPERMDADHTPFGMKCYVCVVPTRGDHVRRAATIVSGVRKRTGLNIKSSFFGDGRTLVTFHFRTDRPDQVERAVDAEAGLWREMVSAGYLPYRCSVDQMERLTSLRPEFFTLVKQLKLTLDPNEIIAPGRYCPV